AEDGIRDFHVTGVQTCALPIWPTIVYVFDELVRTLPDGVYYTSVKRAGDLYTINGVAESNNRISRLMRNLGDSVWFGEPTLISRSEERRVGKECRAGRRR